MGASLRLMNWPLRAKMAALFVLASLLPLGISALIDVRESRDRMVSETASLLEARSDQLVKRIDAFNRSYQRAVDRVAQLPNVVQACAGAPEDSLRLTGSVRRFLDVWPATDGNIVSVTITDPTGTVRISTRDGLVGTNLSGRNYVRTGMLGLPAISDVHVVDTADGPVPTIAYAEPVLNAEKHVVGIAIFCVRASAVWDMMKEFNELAGPQSYAVMFDELGIRIGHSISDDMLFHPGGALPTATINQLVAEDRFGKQTRALLEDVRESPEKFDRARSTATAVEVFRGVSGLNSQLWNLGIGRRLEAVPWTVFYLVPEAAFEPRITQMTRQKLIFTSAIAMVALLGGALVAATIVRPISSLTKATESLARGEAAVLVATNHTDELGRLESSFNTMAERISAQAAALRKSRDEQEERVEQRTTELVKITQDLQNEIAERKEAQQAARQSAARLQTVLENLDTGVAVSDMTGQLTQMNRAALEMHGWSSLEECLRNLIDFTDTFRLAGTDGTPWPVEEWPLARILRGERVRDLEVYIHHLHAGWRRVFSFGGVLINDDDGKPIAAVVTITDITERHLAEIATMRLAAIVESSSDAIIGEDLSSVITSWNTGAERIFGYTAQEMVGQPISIFIPPDRLDDDERILSRIRLGERVEHFDTERVAKNGSLIAVSMTVSPIKDAHGEVIGASKVARNVTESKRAAEQIREMNADLEQRVAARTIELQTANGELEAFSYSVSHDLRAPLRALDGFSQALAEDYEDKLGAEGQDYLQRIRKATQRMGHLIDDLLTLSRITRAEMSREPVDLSKMAQEIVEELRGADPERKVNVSIAEGLNADADPRLMRAALTNLFGNAWKFTAKQAEAEISFGTEIIDGSRVFVIRDNGAGFDMAYAGKLFGAFQRLHAVQDFPGTGIGLATVQRVLSKHGGRIWAEGIVGAGATFRFTL